MSKFRRNRPDLQWPPRSDEEMLAWQRAVGTDLEIARLLGLSRASIYGQRMKFGVAALPRKKRARVREQRAGSRITKTAMRRLYAGREYEDWGHEPAARTVRARGQVQPWMLEPVPLYQAAE
ncbi:MAG: hypothetical protein ABJ215_16015 [Alphaproteobacteria bacterium]